MAKYYGNGVTNTYGGSTVTWYCLQTYTYTQTADTFTVTLEVKMVTDENIHIYGGDCSAALSVDGNVINRANPPGDKWLDPNEANAWTLISRAITYTKGSSAVTHSVSSSVTVSGGAWEGTSTFSNSTLIKVPAKASYTVSYNANGGSGAPASQTKQYNVTLKLSTTKPTRTGYTFAGWATSSTGAVAYASGANYTNNANVTLYAKWTANTYTVAYNSNGGSGSMSNTTFTYNVSGTLRTNTFTRTNYKFIGWATSAGGSVAYTDAQSVKNLATSGTKTLYAVWRSRYSAADVRAPNAYRTVGGSPDDTGTAGIVECSVGPVLYEQDNGTMQVKSTTVKCYYKLNTASSWTQLGSNKTVSGSSMQTFSWSASEGTFSENSQYDIKVEAVADGITSANTTFISIASFIIDIDPDANSIGIFSQAGAADTVVMGLGSDLSLSLDDAAASGTDHDLIAALTVLGVTVT